MEAYSDADGDQSEGLLPTPAGQELAARPVRGGPADSVAEREADQDVGVAPEEDPHEVTPPVFSLPQCSLPRSCPPTLSPWGPVKPRRTQGERE